LKWITDTAGKIKRLEIQGATKIALSAVDALTRQLLEARSPSDAFRALDEGAYELVEARETEPMLRNGLRYIQTHIPKEWSDGDAFRATVERVSGEIVGHFMESQRRIVEIGSRRVRDGNTVLTHCHSSAVTATLIEAHRQGKRRRPGPSTRGGSRPRSWWKRASTPP
jgi:ribose 1,5-bisphosphate isomerase